MAQAKMHSQRKLVTITLMTFWVLGVLVLLDVLLAFVVGPRVSERQQMGAVDPFAVRQIQRRVDRVVQLQQRAALTDAGLVAAVGLSTAREGFDPVQFYHSLRGRYRMLNLGASGGSFTEMQAYSRSVGESSLKADHVIVALHPSWLAGRAHSSSGHSGAPATHRAEDRSWRSLLSRTKEQLIPHSWILSNRPLIHALARSNVEALRDGMGHWFGGEVGLPHLNEFVGDPWVVQRLYPDEFAPADFGETQLAQWEAFGWFDPQRLVANGREARALLDMLTELRRSSPSICIVLMPESSSFRAMVPLSATTAIHTIVASFDPSLPIWDLRGSLPDSAFRDHAHLNSQGRRALTDLISQRIGSLP